MCKIKTGIAVLAVLFLSGCATFNPSREVFKEKVTYNSKEFSVSGGLLYQAVIKVIYAQKFVIEKEDKEGGFILAKRYFQRGKRNIILILQAKLISETDKSVLYLNALQTSERLFVADRTRFFLWLIPLPGGGGKEASKIKEGEKIIEDREFYQKFFDRIEEEINKSKEELMREEESKSEEELPKEEINKPKEELPKEKNKPNEKLLKEKKSKPDEEPKNKKAEKKTDNDTGTKVGAISSPSNQGPALKDNGVSP